MKFLIVDPSPLPILIPLGPKILKQVKRLAGNIFNKQSWSAEQEWSFSLGFGVRLTTSHLQTMYSETSHRPRNSNGS